MTLCLGMAHFFVFLITVASIITVAPAIVGTHSGEPPLALNTQISFLCGKW